MSGENVARDQTGRLGLKSFSGHRTGRRQDAVGGAAHLAFGGGEHAPGAPGPRDGEESHP